MSKQRMSYNLMYIKKQILQLSKTDYKEFTEWFAKYNKEREEKLTLS